MSDKLPSDGFMRALLKHTFGISEVREESRERCPWCGERWECQPTCRSRYDDGVNPDE